MFLFAPYLAKLPFDALMRQAGLPGSKMIPAAHAMRSLLALKINCDLQLTLMASSLYRLLAAQIANEYEHAKSRHLFQDFVDATAQVTLTPDQLIVRFQERAPNPLLLAAGFDKIDARIPWLDGKHLRLILA